MCDCNNGSCDRILSPIDRLHLRIEQLEKRVEWWEKYPTEVGNLIVRLEKMEKALSEEMAKTREMDSILAGVVKRVGHQSEAPETAMSDEREPIVSDRDTNAMCEDYQFLFSGHDQLNSEAWTIGALDMRKRYEELIAKGDLIRKDELTKWLDIEIAMAETNLEHADRTQMVVVVATARAKLATYKAVKAHIEG